MPIDPERARKLMQGYESSTGMKPIADKAKAMFGKQDVQKEALKRRREMIQGRENQPQDQDYGG